MQAVIEGLDSISLEQPQPPVHSAPIIFQFYPCPWVEGVPPLPNMVVVSDPSTDGKELCSEVNIQHPSILSCRLYSSCLLMLGEKGPVFSTSRMELWDTRAPEGVVCYPATLPEWCCYLNMPPQAHGVYPDGNRRLRIAMRSLSSGLQRYTWTIFRVMHPLGTRVLVSNSSSLEYHRPVPFIENPSALVYTPLSSRTIFVKLRIDEQQGPVTVVESTSIRKAESLAASGPEFLAFCKKIRPIQGSNKIRTLVDLFASSNTKLIIRWNGALHFTRVTFTSACSRIADDVRPTSPKTGALTRLVEIDVQIPNELHVLAADSEWAQDFPVSRTRWNGALDIDYSYSEDRNNPALSFYSTADYEVVVQYQSDDQQQDMLVQ